MEEQEVLTNQIVLGKEQKFLTEQKKQLLDYRKILLV
jgi:hypothetical protein